MIFFLCVRKILQLQLCNKKLFTVTALRRQWL